MMELIVLKFDSYPNAIAWLNENKGVAVRGESELMGGVSTHIMFSGGISSAEISMVLEYFPTAEKVQLRLHGDDIVEHPTYSVDETRDAIVGILQGLGATIKKSPCCLEFCSQDEMSLRLEELQVRSGKSLVSSSPEDIGSLYRRLFP